LRNILSTTALTTLRRRKGIPKKTTNKSSTLPITHSTSSEKLAWIATTGTITIMAKTQLVIEARKNASMMIITSAIRTVSAMIVASPDLFFIQPHFNATQQTAQQEG
jgi:hypothetical protein